MTHSKIMQQQRFSVIRSQLLNYEIVEFKINQRYKSDGLPVFSLFVGRLKLFETCDLSVNVRTTLIARLINELFPGELSSFYNYCAYELKKVPEWLCLTRVGKDFVEQMGSDYRLATTGINYVNVKPKGVTESELQMLLVNLGYSFNGTSANSFTLSKNMGHML